MNNCYLWMREQQEETNVEEQDRSLHVVEVCLPTVRQPFQLFDQMLDDEELPELSLSEPDSNSKNNDDPPSSERSSSSRQNAQRDVRNAPSGIPASVASSSQSLMRTSHSKKFLSRSHNSLVFRPPDYSKVESKVRKYIVSMREQQQQKRRQGPKNQLDPAPVPALQLAPSSGLMQLPEDDVTNLKRQLVDQEAMVEVLQEDHDRLLLHNARLQNMLEEMRTRIRILHAHQQQHQRQPPQKERLTNSPPQPEVDKDLSSSQESFSSSIEVGVGPLADIQLGLTHHQHEALSITSSSYLDLPPFGQFNRKTEDDETSSCCDSNSWNSNNNLDQQQYQPTTNKSASAPVGPDKENIIKASLPEEPLRPENNDNLDVLLLTQLKEITIAAVEVRDQTRTIIHKINLVQPS